MGDRQIWYHIREGFRSIFTHGLMSIAAVCMTVACLLIMGSFSLIAINANHVLGDLEDDNQFLAYIDDSLTRAQAQALESQIKAVPNVADIHFVTKEEALANFKANQERQDLFDNVESDTLRDRYEIHVVDIQLMQETVDQVKDIDGIAKVQASLEIADGFVMLRNVATALAIILVVMLVLISISIIANTIIVPFVLAYVYHLEGGIPYFMLTVGIGEVISCGILGMLLRTVLQKYRKYIFDVQK